MEQDVRCLHCGSDNVRRERWSARWAAILMMLVGFMLPVRSDQYHCFDCGRKFRHKGVPMQRKEPPAD